MNKFRHELAPPLYLTAIGVAMIGWLWAIFVGVEWLLGLSFAAFAIEVTLTRMSRHVHERLWQGEFPAPAIVGA